jgi:hypothetical protein
MNSEKTPSGLAGLQTQDSTQAVVAVLEKVGCLPNAGETVVIDLSSKIEFLGSEHICSTIVTNQRLIFCDHKNKKHSYEISAADLKSATFSRLESRHLLVKSKGVTKPMGRMKNGDTERLAAALGIELPPVNAGRAVTFGCRNARRREQGTRNGNHGACHRLSALALWVLFRTTEHRVCRCHLSNSDVHCGCQRKPIASICCASRIADGRTIIRRRDVRSETSAQVQRDYSCLLMDRNSAHSAATLTATRRNMKESGC